MMRISQLGNALHRITESACLIQTACESREGDGQSGSRTLFHSHLDLVRRRDDSADAHGWTPLREDSENLISKDKEWCNEDFDAHVLPKDDSGGRNRRKIAREQSEVRTVPLILIGTSFSLRSYL